MGREGEEGMILGELCLQRSQQAFHPPHSSRICQVIRLKYPNPVPILAIFFSLSL